MPDLRSLVYVSQATRPLSDAELGAILYSSRDYNGRHGITGLLVYERSLPDIAGSFVQCIEGPPDEVGTLFRDRILRASQHHRIVIKRDERIGERRFPSWTMAYERSAGPAPAGFNGLLRRLGPPPSGRVRESGPSGKLDAL